MTNQLINQNLLDKLHSVVIDSNSLLEGNVCYTHHTPLPPGPFEPKFKLKRDNLVNLSNQSRHVLEIGFNAGHSAAIMLSANNNVKVTSVDIGNHDYTRLCAQTINEYFPNRHIFILKNSKHITYEELSIVDAVIIDGDHSPEGFFLDLMSCVAYCTVGTKIIIDDWSIPYIQRIFKLFENFFSEYELLEKDDDQAFFILSKSIKEI